MCLDIWFSHMNPQQPMPVFWQPNHETCVFYVQDRTTYYHVIQSAWQCTLWKIQPYNDGSAQIVIKQKDNWPLHLLSLIFVYNAMPHGTTGYQPYELMFGHKAPTICDVWLRLAHYNDNYLQSKYEWVNQQHEIILAANRHALKRIEQSAENSVSQARGKTLKIPIGNLVLLHDHPEGWKKIQGNYKSKWFVMESKHRDPNVYTIKLLSGKGLMHIVNCQKSQGIIYYIQLLIPIHL